MQSDLARKHLLECRHPAGMSTCKSIQHTLHFVACLYLPGAQFVFHFQLPVRCMRFGEGHSHAQPLCSKRRQSAPLSPYIVSLCKTLACNIYAQPLTCRSSICDGAERLDCSLVPFKSPAALMANLHCRCGRLWWSRPPRSPQTCARP